MDVDALRGNEEKKTNGSFQEKRQQKKNSPSAATWRKENGPQEKRGL